MYLTPINKCILYITIIKSTFVSYFTQCFRTKLVTKNVPSLTTYILNKTVKKFHIEQKNAEVRCRILTATDKQNLHMLGPKNRIRLQMRRLVLELSNLEVLFL